MVKAVFRDGDGVINANEPATPDRTVKSLAETAEAILQREPSH